MIRRATLDDADAVYSLLRQLAISYAPDPESFTAAFPQLVADDSAILLVAEEDAAVIGYALAIVSLLLYTNGKAAQLQELVVDENKRGTGNGGALVRAIEMECRARGVRQLTVASRRAAGFYEARGYSTTADYLKRVLDA
jgi:N-acetylglutamate synthase-like GNAT family acetyltransferase